MNNKTKKILAGLGLGLIGATTLTGCNSITLDQSQIDSLLEKGETFIDSQNDIDYKELAEELKDYIDNDTSRLDASTLKRLMLRNISNLFLLEGTHNMTFVNEQQFSRIEYVSDELTKVYLYTLDDNGEKTNEIYREITPTNVTTYVKDTNMMTIVPFNEVGEIESLFGFDKTKDVALKAEGEYVIWSSVPNCGDVKNYEDIYVEMINFYLDMAKNSEDNLVKWGFQLDIRDNKRVYGFADTANLAQLEMTEYSYKLDMYYSGEYDGGLINPFYDEKTLSVSYGIKFDEENESTIEFDINGYQLVSDYYASQTTTE